MESALKRLRRRHEELLSVRQSHESNWKDILEQILPYRGRWSKEKHNKGAARDSTHVNNKPTRSLRIMAAGLMAGITSPSRPWFHLTTGDNELNERHDVSVYLNDVEEIIRMTLARSGYYQELASGVYRDLGLIANAAMLEEEQADGSIRFEALTIGTYCLDVNAEGEVDTLFHERVMSVRQCVEKFGPENCSAATQKAYGQGNLNQDVEIVFGVFPHDDVNLHKAGPDGMAFSSAWWEKKAKEGDGFLRTSGYEEFPGLCPRWNIVSGESYGRGSPGWECLGDCKALQHQEEQLARLVDKTVDPPMVGPAELRQHRASLLPGDVTYVPNGSGKFEPAVTIAPGSIQAAEAHIMRHEARIEEAFFVDLWMAMLRDQRSERPTATEVEATREEIMLQLGPILENLNVGLLEPSIARTYAILARQGRLPEPPPELEGTEGAVRVEFISVLHQAQRMTSIVGMRELVATVGSLVGLGREDALDKLNVDEIVDEITDILGVKPELVLSEDQVQEVRAAKAKRQAAQEQGQAMLQATEGARNLSGVEPQQLGELANMVSPTAAAQGGLNT